MKKISLRDPVQKLILVRARAHVTLTANVESFAALAMPNVDVGGSALHTAIARDHVAMTVDAGPQIMGAMLDATAVDQAVDVDV